jgi:Cdc6-like AAA superfamily ATPase
MEHLTSDAAKWLNEPKEDRIIALSKDKWIGHTQAQRILARLTELHCHPPSDRMPNLLVVGEPSSGKTVILRHYANQYQPTTDSRRSRPLRWPVLFVQITNGPDERALYETILDVIQAPYAPRARLETVRWHVIQLLRDMEVKLLFLDELHHMLLGGGLQQRKFLAGLKYLANELRIPLICAGIESAHNAICLDEQLASRFEVARLTTWSMNQEFIRLLASFEKVLALR